MEFTIEFYETSSGRCPVQEFLDDLKESDPGKIPPNDRKVALDRKRDWLEKNPV